MEHEYPISISLLELDEDGDEDHGEEISNIDVSPIEIAKKMKEVPGLSIAEAIVEIGQDINSLPKGDYKVDDEYINEHITAEIGSEKYYLNTYGYMDNEIHSYLEMAEKAFKHGESYLIFADAFDGSLPTPEGKASPHNPIIKGFASLQEAQKAFIEFILMADKKGAGEWHINLVKSDSLIDDFDGYTFENPLAEYTYMHYPIVKNSADIVDGEIVWEEKTDDGENLIMVNGEDMTSEAKTQSSPRMWVVKN